MIICFLITPTQYALAKDKAINVRHGVINTKNKVIKAQHGAVNINNKIVPIKHHAITTKGKALSNEPFADAKNYVGIDCSFISNTMKSSTYAFKDQYGKNAFPDNPFLYGAFLVHQFNDRFGIEASYETQNTKNRKVTLGPGDAMPGGAIIGPGVTMPLETKIKTQHFQTGLRIKLHEFENRKHINLWTQLGVTYFQMKAEQILFENTGAISPDNTRNYKKWKLTPVVKLGVNYNWTKRVGLRASAEWINTSILHAKSQERPDSSSEIKLRDNFNFGVGIYFKL